MATTLRIFVVVVFVLFSRNINHGDLTGQSCWVIGSTELSSPVDSQTTHRDHCFLFLWVSGVHELFLLFEHMTSVWGFAPKEMFKGLLVVIVVCLVLTVRFTIYVTDLTKDHLRRVLCCFCFVLGTARGHSTSEQRLQLSLQRRQQQRRLPVWCACRTEEEEV